MIGPHGELLSHITPFAKVDCARVSVHVGGRATRSRTSTHDIEVRLDGKRVQRLNVGAPFGHAVQYPM